MKPKLVSIGRTAGAALLVFAIYLLFSRVAAWSIYEPGWTDNHERVAMFQRVEGMRRAYLTHDFYPLWNPFCENGHGDAWPLFYHRAFNIVGGLLALVLGAYRATKLTILAVIAFGASGTHWAARRLAIPRAMRFACGALFACSAYALTDWSVRGAVAEFTAMALCPWLIGVAIDFGRGRPVGVRLGLVMAALFHAHSLICYFALPVALLAGMFAIVYSRDRVAAWNRLLVDGLKSSGTFLALVVPSLILVHLVGSRFSVDRLGIYDPSRGHYAMERYLFDPHDWGSEFRTVYSVELGRGILLLFIGSAFAVLATRTRVRNAATTFMLLLVALYTFLLTPASAATYRSVPGMMLLGFPYRLLSLLVPLTILLSAIFIAALVRTFPRGRLATYSAVAVAVAWQFTFFVIAQKTSYTRFTEREVKASLTYLDGPNYDEYLPRTKRTIPPRTEFFTLNGCTTVGGAPLPQLQHLGSVEVALEAPDGCVVDISQFCSPILEVTTTRGTVGCSLEGTFRVEIPKGQSATVRIARRTYFGVIREAWKSRHGA